MRKDEARTRVLSADRVLDPGSDERALGGAVTVALRAGRAVSSWRLVEA